MNLKFDRSYWPSEVMEVPAKPYDLADLWVDCEDQASVFVAEALIDDPPDFRVSLEDGKPQAECFLWTVGGDTVTLYADLCEAITDDSDYEGLALSPEQAGDVRERLAALDLLSAAIQTARDKYNRWMGTADNGAPAP